MSDLSLQISNVIDELGVFAQWLIGKDKTPGNKATRGKTLTDLFNAASEHVAQRQGRNRDDLN